MAGIPPASRWQHTHARYPCSLTCRNRGWHPVCALCQVCHALPFLSVFLSFHVTMVIMAGSGGLKHHQSLMPGALSCSDGGQIICICCSSRWSIQPELDLCRRAGADKHTVPCQHSFSNVQDNVESKRSDLVY